MRVNSIQVSWFRGASASAVLETELKNVVVYGANGSGKSTFCDAIEYITMRGKIDHLRHEYSGVRQEKGIRNTHAPDEVIPLISIGFEGDISVGTTIAADGTPSFTSSPPELINSIQSWELEQFILRQDEVAWFVLKPKGDKYSALLPLLGLQNFEQATDNLNTLTKHIIAQSNLITKAERLKVLKEEALRHLSDISEEAVLATLRELAIDYIVGDKPTEQSELTTALAESINKRLESMTPDITRYTLLRQIHDESLSDKIDAVTSTHERVLGRLDSFLDTRIEILQKAQGWLGKLDKWEGEMDCPACGRSIRVEDFGRHVHDELETMEEISLVRNSAKSAQAILKSALEKVQGLIADEALSSWLADEADSRLKEAMAGLSRLNLSTWQDEYPAGDITQVEELVPVILTHIKLILDTTPPSNKKLVDDLRVVEVSASIDEIFSLEIEVARIDHIRKCLALGEAAIRSSIKIKTEDTVSQISGDIQNLWSKLHPGEPIEDVRLYIPDDTDKAIDISLKFFGVTQPSPRLTLSEGHRNSLGLCIFLGLAGCGHGEIRPIFLDDIVSSWDREHRGMLTGILKEGLGSRQILLFTHDREWFHELRTVLPASHWKFAGLRPWVNPTIGLQWSESQATFDDARILIDQNPEAAGNCVRVIMDTQLGIIAERLQIEMPYKRGDRNDHRTCIEFLERIISDGRKQFRKKLDDSWLEFKEPISEWNLAHALLLAWANRASHIGSLVPNEVKELIQACEIALDRFKCADCGDFVWSADRSKQERLQCTCGNLQWRYG
ncbi:hypothetical protein ACFLWS_06980 [Chloroflexota bacterium]